MQISLSLVVNCVSGFSISTDTESSQESKATTSTYRLIPGQVLQFDFIRFCNCREQNCAGDKQDFIIIIVIIVNLHRSLL